MNRRRQYGEEEEEDGEEEEEEAEGEAFIFVHHTIQKIFFDTFQYHFQYLYFLRQYHLF
jgi:hypothetical protein